MCVQTISVISAGVSGQPSISGISDRQFGEVIGYDLIVAEDVHVSAGERVEIDGLLKSENVKSHASAAYESLTKAAGSKGDEQEVTLLVPDDTEEFARYMDLRDHESGDAALLCGQASPAQRRHARGLEER